MFLSMYDFTYFYMNFQSFKLWLYVVYHSLILKISSVHKIFSEKHKMKEKINKLFVQQILENSTSVLKIMVTTLRIFFSHYFSSLGTWNDATKCLGILTNGYFGSFFAQKLMIDRTLVLVLVYQCQKAKLWQKSSKK